ncbi:hypothetical protein AVEN_152389-1 [Araneus ventricosus]|uniref:Uncharacterized protein n=1 Tax=Araneus ventricosus TaxID=182803 RepID=A0A4Y2DB05_ARAVE|nr:hypothetical protein AVEN_152389-1 [Araneus ventricosus]
MEIDPGGNCLRGFIIPAVDFRATDYVGLIDWQPCNVTKPTVLRQISSHELLKMIQDDVPMDGRDLIKFPSHTQASHNALLDFVARSIPIKKCLH